MTNFYKRITGSEIQGDGSTVVQPAGTITVDSNTNTLKLHDGSTPGGNSIGGGSLGGFAAYYNSLYTTNADDLYIAPLWDSGPGPAYLKLPGYPNSTGNAVVLSNYQEGGAGVSIVSSNPRNGNTEYVWNFGSNGELSLPTGGNIGATKGGTMLDGGFGYGTSVTSYYPSGMYSSCVTANPDGTLSISTYGDGTGMSGQWTFGTAGVLTLPASSGQIGRSGYTDGIDLYNNNGGTGYVRMNYADESAVWADVSGSHIQTTGGTWDFGTDGNLTLPAGGVVNSAGGTGPVAVQSNDGSTTYTWTFGTDGSLTLPQTDMQASPQPTSYPGITFTDGSKQISANGILKVSSVPTHSTGAPGDTVGMVAFDGNYIYYCKQDYAGDTVIAYTGSLLDNFDGYSTYGFNKITTDITGWTLTVPGQSTSVTVIAVDQSMNGGAQTGLQFSGAVTFTLTETFTFRGPSVTDIWKRFAWSGDTW